MTPFLLEDEVIALTRPLRQPAAQKRFLKRIGVPFIVGAAGQPIISREGLGSRLSMGGGELLPAAAEAVVSTPNRDALLARLASRKKKKGVKHGTTA